MNQHPQASPRCRHPHRAISTPAEARKLAEELMDVMSALLGIIERETELVRAGKIREAMQLEEQKKRAVGPLHGRSRKPEERAKISRAGRRRNC